MRSKKLFFSLNRDSAPGPDGFPNNFYQDYWDLVKTDVVILVRDFFMRGYLPNGIGAQLLTLIPKVDNASEASQFRPVALSNSLFKIISKILVNRIAPLAQNFISWN